MKSQEEQQKISHNPPSNPTADKWTLEDVHEHLAHAVNLEIWTIPYYMTIMYSIKESSDPIFRLLQSVVYQEMLHAELAANVYNSFQPPELKLGPFLYTKKGGVPHLNFEKDKAASEKYRPYSAELGGLDLTRSNTTCLVELPETKPPSDDPKETEYATIGDFYDALRYGMQQHAHKVVGNQNQVDYFGNFYGNLNQTTVTGSGRTGLDQALELIDVITEQGEGRRKEDQEIPEAFRNTADGYNPSWSHFLKFNSVRDLLLSGRAPETYQADPSKKDTETQQVLIANFSKLITALEELFNGKGASNFGAIMPTVGANINTCWRNGVIPQYTSTPKGGTE
jgi:hypothetical protein